MKKKSIFLAGLAAIFTVIILIVIYIVTMQNKPIDKFKKYLEDHQYSCSGTVCSMQSKTEDENMIETYTESYDFKEHTFTAKWVDEYHSDEIVFAMEFIYHYADDTVTMNQYDSADAYTEHKPDTVYAMNREEVLECDFGNISDTETDLHDRMLQFKGVLKKHLEEADVTLQDIIL